jgi:Uma2 family endonuclease
MITAPMQLLTAEEYGELPDNGQPTELVRGKVVPVNMPYPRHGEICAQIVYLLRVYLEPRSQGRVVGNDSGVVTERGPDSVRGPDVAYYSFRRIPPGPIPKGYLSVLPELVFEVRSYTDRWPPLLAKVAEFLSAGVSVVCVVDDATESVHVYTPDDPVRILPPDAELVLPDVLPDFRVPVRRLFE